MAQQFERLAAELAWLTQAPDLLQPPAGLELSLSRKAPPITVSALMSHLDRYQPGFRLGDRFENLVLFYLKYIHNIFDIKRNIQVKNESLTIGELDFLLPVNQRWTHLEVALKLYLLDGSGHCLSQFIGTRRDDCLETKWQHMLDHQIRLSEAASAQQTLQQLGIDMPPEQALWVKGWLFYHRGQIPDALPAPLNPEHQRGWWLTQSELRALVGNGQHYLIPTKKDWLVPAAMVDEPLLDLEQLKERVGEHERAQLILVVSYDAQGRLVEQSRGFVVSDRWPSNAS